MVATDKSRLKAARRRRKASVQSRAVWSAAGLPPQVKAAIVRSDRRSTRRGVMGGLVALVLTATAAALLTVTADSKEASPVLAALKSGQRLFAGEAPPQVAERRAQDASEALKVAAAKAATAETIKPAAEKPATTDIAVAPTAKPAEPIRSAAAAPPAAPAPTVKPADWPELPVAAVEPKPVITAPAAPAPVAAVAPEAVPPVPEARATEPRAKLAARAPVGEPVGETALTKAPVERPPVDKASCVREVEIAAKSIIISFDVRSAVISPVQLEQLKRFAAFLSACPQAKVEIAGHTDLKGQQEGNFQLSWDRAESVLKALKTHGLDPNRFTVVGYGPRRPLSQSTDATNYNPVDRRVELFVR
jgi:outer membrane protein OmpA-like peptidoglycan-associated protein